VAGSANDTSATTHASAAEDEGVKGLIGILLISRNRGASRRLPTHFHGGCGTHWPIDAILSPLLWRIGLERIGARLLGV
jgi:hypothetical protein